MDSYVKSDLYRCSGATTYKHLLIRLLKDPGFRFLYFFRMSRRYRIITPHGFLYNLFYKRYSIKYGIQIPKSVEIDQGFLIIHIGGIVINSNTKIGNNVTLMHNVTIGNTKRGKNMGAPTIGNRVYIGPGAAIVGGISIGDNVLIAPNSYVNFDVPTNSVVIGNPGKILENINATSGYVNNIYL